MNDLFEDEPAGGGNTPEFTVSELSGAVKKTIEGEFGHVRVRAEVGRVSRPGSGHLYFDLKDDRSVLAAVSWKGQVAKMQVRPEEGMEVIATGRMTTFPGQSRYQLIVENVEPAGAGALMAMLEARRKALAAEGLFAEDRKQPIPFLPGIIGVVTSPSGAVIRDILHRLRDRFPRKVLVWPVAVQGQNCAPEVARAIDGFNALTPGGALPRPDLIIVARGGGSVEDLWGFNEEIVVRAAAASRIPLISAVGHETDTTLIDYASDWRAPTPTAAAEKAVPVRVELAAWVSEQEARLGRAITQATGQRRQRLADVARAMGRPEVLIEGASQRLDNLSLRLPGALRSGTQVKRVALTEAAAGLRPGALRRQVGLGRDKVSGLADRLSPAARITATQGRRALAGLADRLDPARIVLAQQKRSDAFDDLTRRFDRASQAQIGGWRDRLAALERMRQSLGYTETLRRGYAVVRGTDGSVLTRAEAAQGHKALELEFADGKMQVLNAGAGPIAVKPAAKPPAPKGKQGSLFD